MDEVQVVDSLADSQETAIFEDPIGLPNRVVRIGQMQVQCVAENCIKRVVWKPQFIDTADFKTRVADARARFI